MIEVFLFASSSLYKFCSLQYYTHKIFLLFDTNLFFHYLFNLIVQSFCGFICLYKAFKWNRINRSLLLCRHQDHHLHHQQQQQHRHQPALKNHREYRQLLAFRDCPQLVLIYIIFKKIKLN